MNLFIFSDDLRIKDNRALFESSLDQNGLVALFIIDKAKNKAHGDSSAKLKLKLLGLEKITESLNSLNISLKILYSKKILDEPGDILDFCKSHGIKKIFLNSEYPFNEKQRNENLEKICRQHQISFKEYNSQLIDPNDVKNNSGLPFKVFTPYSKKIRSLMTQDILSETPSPLKQKNRILDHDEIPQFQDAYDQELNFSFDDLPITESSAIQKLDDFVDSSIQKYKELRDIPSLSATSNLSSSFAIGLISSKQAINLVLERKR
jgi:deoxyribodipyrimidine photo-lyase